MVKVKFATKLSVAAVEELRAYAKESKRTVSDIVDEAVLSHLRSVRIRPAFRRAVEEVLEDHKIALRKLAE